MIEKTLAKRYAGALLDETERSNAVEATEAQLLALKEAYHRDENFRTALNHPKIPRSKKAAMLRLIFEGKSDPAVVNFLELLVNKNRTTLIPDIADMYDRLADRTRGVVRVEVRSHLALTDAQRRTLKSKLSAWLGGKKVDIQAVEDRTLLGGMSMRIGDTVIDGSVAGRLKNLREQLLESERLKVTVGGQE